MRLKKFFEFNEDNNLGDVEAQPSTDKYTDLKSDLSEMIQKSLNTGDKKTFDDFIQAIVKDPEESQIEGLINDSDVYEFYLKYRNDIDEILSDSKFFDDVPSESNVSSLYDYMILGTKKAVNDIIPDIKESSEPESPEIE